MYIFYWIYLINFIIIYNTSIIHKIDTSNYTYLYIYIIGYETVICMYNLSCLHKINVRHYKLRMINNINKGKLNILC